MPIRHRLRSNLTLAALAVIAVGARANRDVILDRFGAAAPVAAAARVAEAETVPLVEPAPAPVAHEVSRGADGLFYVNVKVNGRPLRFLVDTGASVVVLTAADARAVGAGVEERHYNRSVQTVGGDTAMAWTTLSSVDIAGHRITDLQAAVVRDGLHVSLLGQNMLARLDSVTINGDRLSLR